MKETQFFLLLEKGGEPVIWFHGDDFQLIISKIYSWNRCIK